MTFRRAFLALFSTALLLGLAWGCSAADNAADAPLASGGSNALGEAGNDADLLMPESGTQDSGQLGVNPLCGNGDTIKCVPELPTSCDEFVPPAAASDDAGPSADAAAGGQAGAIGQGGEGGDNAGPASSSGAAGEGGAGGAAGAAGGPALSPGNYGCQVRRLDSASLQPGSACALAGSGGENAPCLTASDCLAGLGCVGDQNGGLCQWYCCQDADECEQGSYCAARPMRDATVNAIPKGTSAASVSLLIPVCVHAENCDLSAPYPCPKGSECACASGTACLVVRSDGTTTCAVPGTGKAGEACPCAWGHVCSASTSQCLKLCNTRDSGTCGDGKCQAASELPDGWGVCVGVTPGGG